VKDEWKAAELLIRNKEEEFTSFYSRFIQKEAGTMVEIARLMWGSINNGGKVLFFGNGGSAADAQHLAGELVNRLKVSRRPLPAIALTVNSSVITSVANDLDYSKVFSLQIEALGRKEDVAVGISTSGRSENVISGILTARRLGLTTVGFTGKDGGRLKEIVDYLLLVPSGETPRIQEGHITAGHLICELIEEKIVALEGGR
jgi:D-sedoheptulose 7-phosphate isomerase